MEYESRDFYFLDETLFNKVHKNWVRNRFLTPLEFVMVIRWKSNRSIAIIRRAFKKEGIRAFTHALNDAVTSGNEQALIDLYDELRKKNNGLRVRIFSAFLAVRAPEKYPVFDQRIFYELRPAFKNRKTFPDDKIRWYFQTFAPKVRELARNNNPPLSLREFDELYWGKSIEKTLGKYAAGR